MFTLLSCSKEEYNAPILIVPDPASTYYFEVDGIRYSGDPETGQAKVAEYPTGSYKSKYEGSIIIPETIGVLAFCDCSNLTDITIGSGVKTIGECAFLEEDWHNTEFTIQKGSLKNVQRKLAHTLFNPQILKQ